MSIAQWWLYEGMDGGSPMKTYTGTDYFQGESLDYAIDSFLPAGRLILLNAREGTGKTKIALSMAHSIATGTPFLDQPSAKGKIFWFNLDNMHPLDIAERCKELGEKTTPNDPFSWCDEVTWCDEQFDLTSYMPNTATSITEYLCSLCAGYKLIVFDTLAKLFTNSDVDEMSAKETDALMSQLVVLARKTEAAVLVLHHMPKDLENRTARGSTAIAARCDLELIVDGSMINKTTITVKKSRIHRIHIFPVKVDVDGFLLSEEKSSDEPVGAWYGLINQKQMNMSRFDAQQKRLKRLMLYFGEMGLDNYFSMTHNQIMEVLIVDTNKAEAVKEMKQVLQHEENNGRIKRTKHGNNPIYSMQFTDDEVTDAMIRRARRSQMISSLVEVEV